MTRILMTASLTLASGDVPLLLDRALRDLGCDTELVFIDQDLPLLETVLHDSPHDFARALFNRRFARRVRAFQPHLVLVYGSNWGIFPKRLRWWP